MLQFITLTGICAVITCHVYRRGCYTLRQYPNPNKQVREDGPVMLTEGRNKNKQDGDR